MPPISLTGPALAAVLALEFLVAVIALRLYFRFASVHGPYAMPTDRSLHQGVIPRGAGLGVAVAVLLGAGAMAAAGVLTGPLAAPLLLGGSLVTLSGMADDRMDIRPRYRLLMQLAAAVLVLLATGVGITGPGVIGIVAPAALIFALLWFYNLINFVDGSDGMAGAAVLFVAGLMGGIFLAGGDADLALVLWLMAAAAAAFLLWNRPPAKMFLGDAGTFFLAFAFSIVVLTSLARGDASVWTWLTVFGFYFADTTTTTTIRAFTVPGFWRRHRSHAYQNLARLRGHRSILLLVVAINVLWVMPWTLATVLDPPRAPPYAVVAWIPLVLFSLRYGPRFEDA